MITIRDLRKSKEFPNACKDKFGRLRVAAAVGAGNDALERAEAIISAGADIIVVDAAHGHSKGVIDVVKKLKKSFANTDIIAGNMAT